MHPPIVMPPSVLTLLVCAVILSSCTRREPSPDTSGTVAFGFDPALVAHEAVVDSGLGVSFHGPRGWEPIPESVLTRARTVVGQNAGSAAVDLRARGYVLESEGAMMVMSLNPGFDTADTSSTLRAYRGELEAQYPGGVRESIFRSPVHKVHQLIAGNSNRMTVRMVLSSPRRIHPLQIDFLCPVDAYPRFARVLESVIGSIRDTLSSLPINQPT